MNVGRRRPLHHFWYRVPVSHIIGTHWVPFNERVVTVIYYEGFIIVYVIAKDIQQGSRITYHWDPLGTF